ncbi:MAG: nitroreductase family protein [Candidatus Aminicenantes bacterium]|nr:nitroreductase family protein [Candidatus Aminicenantes bacterium]
MIEKQNEDKMTPFLRIVTQRKSIRRFNKKQVDRKEILKCLEAARLAPSAENAQPWRYLVIDDPAVKRRYEKEAFSGIYSVSKFAKEAPVFILVMARMNVITHRIGRQIQKIQFHLIDIGISGEHLVLQAEELGIGTCWMGWFNVRKTRKFFNIPKKYKIVALIAMGRYDKRPSRERKRKKMQEVVWFNKVR